jgi:hypothetical protein
MGVEDQLLRPPYGCPEAQLGGRLPPRSVLTATDGSANGATYKQGAKCITLGSGVFAYGAPRVFEWGTRVAF